jgi:invasion protein IalB
MNKICRSGFALCSLVAGAALAGSLMVSSQAVAQEEQQQQQDAAWVKLCEKAPSLQEEGQELDVCLTHHERIDGNTGRVLVSAAIRQVEGKDTRSLMVMVPLGMALPAGVQAKVDDNEAIKLNYTLCHVGGCTAETEATDEIIEQFRNGEQVVVAAMNLAGKPIGFPVPLSGFTKAYAGDPVDNEKYRAARQQLMQTIRQRQIAMMKRAQEEQQAQQEGQGQQ